MACAAPCRTEAGTTSSVSPRWHDYDWGILKSYSTCWATRSTLLSRVLDTLILPLSLYTSTPPELVERGDSCEINQKSVSGQHSVSYLTCLREGNVPCLSWRWCCSSLPLCRWGWSYRLQPVPSTKHILYNKQLFPQSFNKSVKNSPEPVLRPAVGSEW